MNTNSCLGMGVVLIEAVSQSFMFLMQLTGEKLRYWEDDMYVNYTPDEFRDMYNDTVYKLSLDSFVARFCDSGADSYGEANYIKQWAGNAGDWGYIAILKSPRDEAGALVELGMMDEHAEPLCLNHYRCVVRYPVTSDGRKDHSRPCECYGLSDDASLLALSTLSFAELFNRVCELKMNIFLNDDRLRRPWPDASEE